MTDTTKQDKEIERHFMRALDVALADKGLNQGQAEVIAGLGKGTISKWMLGQRMPSALRFAEVAAKLDINPGDLVNDGFRRAREAGLLDDVEVPPRSE